MRSWRSGAHNSWEARVALECFGKRAPIVVPVLVEDQPDGLTVAIHSVQKKPLETWWKEVEGSFDPIAPPILESRSERLALEHRDAPSGNAISAQSASTFSCDP